MVSVESSAKAANVEGSPQKPDTIRSRKELSFAGTMKDSVLQYYSHIHQAEKFILQDSLQLALKSYIKAFSYKKPFFRDYRNARKVYSLQTSVDSTVYQFLHDQKPLVINRNMKTSEQIDSIFRLDQEARNPGNNITSTDASNYNFIKNLLATKSFSDHHIGFNASTKLHTLLLHLSRYENFDILLYMLYDAVLQGDLDNRAFAELADSYYGHHITFDKLKTQYSTQYMWPLYTKFLLPQLSQNESTSINDKRKAIGLEALNDQYEKQYYNFIHGYSDYEFYQFFTYFPADGPKENHEYLVSERQMLDEIMSKSGKWIIWSE